MKKIILLFFILISCFSTNYAQNAWTYKGQKNGVKGYTRYVNKNTEMRFICNSSATLSAFIGVFFDVPNHKKWMTGIEPSTIYYKKENSLEVCYRSVVPFPWPFSPRDAIMVGTGYQDAATKTVYLKVRPNSSYKPVNEGFVRLNTFEMDVSLYPKANKTVELDCVMRLGEADHVPMWLVNWLVTDRFFTVVYNLSELVKKAPYAGYTNIAIKN